MTWTKQQIREMYRSQLQEVSYAVRHSDPPVTPGVNAPNVTVGDREAQNLERRALCQSQQR